MDACTAPALTGIKGLDLYCLEDAVWRFAGVGRPSGKENKATLVAHMEPKMREFLLYLPLYDGITDLQIGVDSLSEILLPAINLPVREKPIVFYGTSILQGGCATRPGMAHTNILSRWLNRETINLGFSGNGLLDVEIAEIMAHIDASVYVLDFVPNCQAARIDSLAERFYKVIRERQPYTPMHSFLISDSFNAAYLFILVSRILCIHIPFTINKSPMILPLEMNRSIEFFIV